MGNEQVGDPVYCSEFVSPPPHHNLFLTTQERLDEALKRRVTPDKADHFTKARDALTLQPLCSALSLQVRLEDIAIF